jgi:hypothetical protein
MNFGLATAQYAMHPYALRLPSEPTFQDTSEPIFGGHIDANESHAPPPSFDEQPPVDALVDSSAPPPYGSTSKSSDQKRRMSHPLPVSADGIVPILIASTESVSAAHIGQGVYMRARPSPDGPSTASKALPTDAISDADMKYVANMPKSLAEMLSSSKSNIKNTVPTQNSCFNSLSFKIRGPIPITLILGLIVAMVLPVVLLQNQSSSWMTQTSTLMTQNEVLNLQRILSYKSQFVSYFLDKSSFELACAAQWIGLLLDGSLLALNWENRGQYLTSYSLDTLAVPTQGVATGNTKFNMGYSGYFIKTAALCQNQYPATCFSYLNTTAVRMTSLMDLKFQAYFYKYSLLDFIQIGFSDGSTRLYAWTDKRTYANGGTCNVDLTTNVAGCSVCSACVFPNCPAYDSKCRSWYQTAVANPDPNKVFFQNPRKASSGNIVSTSVMSLFPNRNPANSLQAVLTFNVISSQLSTSVNSVKILTTGFVYMLGADLSTVIFHPRLAAAPASCTTIDCVDGIDTSAGSQYVTQVITPLQSGMTGVTSLTRAGQSWRLAYTPVVCGTVTYYLIAQVANDDIEAPALAAQASINQAMVSQTVVYAIVLSIMAVIVCLLAALVANALLKPVLQLQSFLQKVQSDQLDEGVPNVRSVLRQRCFKVM